eukprot:2296228-Ditylum_brightwellii.AAC.1
MDFDYPKCSRGCCIPKDIIVKGIQNKGNCIPQGMLKIAGEGAYKQSLRKHNEYLTFIIAIAMEGLHKGALCAT